MIQFIIAIFAAIVTAVVASNRGRNAIGWFFLGFLCWPLGLILVFTLPDLKEEAAKHQRLEAENRRLREQINQERVKGETFRQHAVARLDAHDEHLGVNTRQLNTPATAERNLPGPPNLVNSLEDMAGSPDPSQSGQAAWYYENDGQTKGPITQSALRELLQRRQIAPTTLIWAEHLPEWQSANTVAEFQGDTSHG